MADMATQPITGLPSKTASQMANTDKLLGIDNAEGYQMLIQDLGDYIIQHATSLLAGSNRTLATVINLLNSKVSPYTYANETGSFLDWVQSTFTVNGTYYVIFASNNGEGWPVNVVGTCMVQKRNSDYYLYAFINETNMPDNQAIYVCRYTNNSWKSWSKLPTRAEMDSANKNLIVPANRTNIPDNSDINGYTTPGVYAVASDASASTMTHMPRNASGKLIVLVRGNNTAYIQQKYITTSSAYVEYVRNYNNGTWTEWEQLPTRAEMDAVTNRITSYYVNGTTGTTFTLPNGYRGMLYTIDSAGNRCGQWYIWATGAGAIGFRNVVSTDVVTLENATNELTIKSSEGGTPTAVFENFVYTAIVNA